MIYEREFDSRGVRFALAPAYKLPDIYQVPGTTYAPFRFKSGLRTK